MLAVPGDDPRDGDGGLGVLVPRGPTGHREVGPGVQARLLDRGVRVDGPVVFVDQRQRQLTEVRVPGRDPGPLPLGVGEDEVLGEVTDRRAAVDGRDEVRVLVVGPAEGEHQLHLSALREEVVVSCIPMSS